MKKSLITALGILLIITSIVLNVATKKADIIQGVCMVTGVVLLLIGMNENRRIGKRRR